VVLNKTAPSPGYLSAEYFNTSLALAAKGDRSLNVLMMIRFLVSFRIFKLNFKKSLTFGFID
jgi:hypothetical protein